MIDMTRPNEFHIWACAASLLALVFLLPSCKPWTLDVLSDRKCQVKTEMLFDSNGHLLLKCEYIYNDLDSLGEILKRDSLDRLLWHAIKNYDPSGHLIEELHYDSSNALTYRLTQEWTNGRLAVVSQYDDQGNLLESIEYLYDVSGFVGRTKKFNPPSTLVIENYVNNVNGKPDRIFRIQESSGDTLAIFEFTYDAQGNRTQFIWSGPNLTKTIRRDWIYNSEGNIEEEIFYLIDKASGNIDQEHRTKYLYNAAGNNTDIIVSYMGQVIGRYAKDPDEHGYVKREWTLDAYGNPLAWRDFEYNCKDYPIH